MKKENISSKHPFYKYTSVARTLVRNSWLFHFVLHLIEGLQNRPDASLTTCAKDAYKVALAPHHPLLIRTAASVAFVACPNKKKFFKLFVECSPDEPESALRLEKMHTALTPVWENLMKLLKDN